MHMSERLFWSCSRWPMSKQMTIWSPRVSWISSALIIIDFHLKTKKNIVWADSGHSLHPLNSSPFSRLYIHQKFKTIEIGRHPPTQQKLCFSCSSFLTFPNIVKIENITFEFRKAVDADGDGEITKEEFVENAMKSRFMKKMLES